MNNKKYIAICIDSLNLNLSRRERIRLLREIREYLTAKFLENRESYIKEYLSKFKQGSEINSSSVYFEERKKPMIIQRLSTAGFCLNYMDEDDLRSLLTLIKSGGLVDGRRWDRVKNEIESELRYGR